MKKIYLTALLCLSFIMMLSLAPNAKAQAIKEIEVDHTFKVTFSKEVELNEADTYITLTNSNTADAKTPFTVGYGDTKKIVTIKPKTVLSANDHYILTVKSGMPSISGKKLKTTTMQKFYVKETPKTLAPIKESLKEHLQTYKKTETNNILIYGGDNVTQETVNGLANAFDTAIQSYLTRFFPEIASSNKKATVVVLGNDADQQTYAAAGGYINQSALGWISHKDNVIVMTKDSVNTNLLAHEYVHWMFSNVYHTSVPLWINEASAFLYALGYSEQKDQALDISTAKTYVQNAYTYPIVDSNLKTSYSRESLAAMTMLLDEYGLASLHHVLLDAQKMPFEQAWQQHYGVSYDETITYTYKARTYYENYLKEHGYDIEGLKAYNEAHANEKPISDLAFNTQLQLFGKYQLIETPLYRIYASPAVSAATLEAVKSYTATITPLYDTNMTTRPLLILLSPAEAIQLAQDNDKESITGYGYLKNSLALTITAPSHLTTSKKSFIEKCLTKYYVK